MDDTCTYEYLDVKDNKILEYNFSLTHTKSSSWISGCG